MGCSCVWVYVYPRVCVINVVRTLYIPYSNACLKGLSKVVAIFKAWEGGVNIPVFVCMHVFGWFMPLSQHRLQI